MPGKLTGKEKEKHEKQALKMNLGKMTKAQRDSLGSVISDVLKHHGGEYEKVKKDRPSPVFSPLKAARSKGVRDMLKELKVKHEALIKSGKLKRPPSTVKTKKQAQKRK
ncbi:MAG: hypothetical protein GY861_03785 [bacterium]|nr:hypothetical protein [bacterium]